MSARRRAERPTWCGRCDPETRLVDREDGVAARCVRCHAAMQPGGRHAPQVRGGSMALDAMVGNR